MKALYRTYRPTKLADVIGQEQVTEPLASSIKQGRISHAYLFIGPRGCGKTSVARILAHEVNGFEYNIEDDYVDIIEIDGASNRGIDNIRELREKVAIAPTSGKYKVYIIDEVHMLTKEAFNALLKTLEEPPEHAIFIMATTDAYKVPVTITSRAQVYTFKLSTPQVMLDYVKKIAKKEKIKITDDALEVIVRRGGGSYRDTLSLLDQISTISDKEITKDIVIDVMGLPQDEKIGELLAQYASGDMSGISDVLRELLNSGIKAETIAEEMISQILTEPRPDLMSLLAKLPEIKAPFAEAKLLVALCSNAKSPAGATISTRPVATIPKAAPVAPKAATPAPTAKVSAPNETAIAQEQPTKDFNLDGFITAVDALNDAIGAQVKKCTVTIESGELHIYPSRNITRTILSRDNNKKILINAANGLKVIIHKAGEKPASAAEEDPLLSKISGIMGGEVINDGGSNPF